MLIEKCCFEKMPYRKYLILGNIISIGIILCGCIALGLSYYSRYNNILNDFARGFYTGTGGGLVGAGIVTITLNMIKLKDKEKLKKAEIEKKDERNKIIIQKSLSTCFFISFFAIYIGVLVSGLMNMYVFKTLLAVLMMQVVMLFIIFVVIKKLM